MAATARANGFKRMFVPEVDAPEAALIPDLEVIQTDFVHFAVLSARAPKDKRKTTGQKFFLFQHTLIHQLPVYIKADIASELFKPQMLKP